MFEISAATARPKSAGTIGVEIGSMPRSSRSTTARSSTAPTERTRKRAASKQRSIYTIPQSPDGHGKEDNGSENPDTTLRGSTAASSPDRAGNCHDEKTPGRTPMDVRRPDTSIDALAAVTSLLDSARTSQIELEQVKSANRDLKTLVGQLQTELRLEKEKVTELQWKCEGEALSRMQRDKDAGRELQELTDALKSFRGVASGVMPLLDVLAGAVDIRYDEHAERLWDLLKAEKGGPMSGQDGVMSATTNKKGSGTVEKNNRCGNKRETSAAPLERRHDERRIE